MSTRILQGQGTSGGIAIGSVTYLTLTATIPHHRISKTKIVPEKRRFQKAVLQTKEEWHKVLSRLSHFHAREQIRILQSYLLILQDPLFLELCEAHIQKARVNAEWALELTGQNLSVALAEKDPIASFKRGEDIQAVVSKILNHLGKKEPFSDIDKNKIKGRILVTDNAGPETVAFLHRLGIAGLITSGGGKNSHTMILARSLCLPAASGVENIKAVLAPGKKIILNGFEGKIFVDPSPAELQTAADLLKKQELLEKLLLEETRKPSVTRDRQKIRIEANVELPEEVPTLLKYGAEGIGLFRTESLFWNPAKPPSEKEQTRLYTQVLATMKNRPVTFRTFDVSGEQWMGQAQNNPALGLRGIRFGLKEKNLLKTQLKALLQAASSSPRKNKLKILLPMVSSLEEIDHFRLLLKEIAPSFRQKIPLGMMIEVPAAGLMVDAFAKQVDFFAIGSNDLIQYTLAMDRTNEGLVENYSSYHPAVLKMLSQIVQSALKAKKPITLCGELGGDPLFIPVLLGLGIRRFSMNPLSIPRAKKAIRSLSAKHCALWLKSLMKLSRTREIEKELNHMRLTLDTPWRAG